MFKFSRTLYHGTVIDNKDEIRRFGLIPSVGGFVEEMYGTDVEDYLDNELVFLADKKGLQKAYNAICNHVARKLNKTMWDVTEDDIKRHGLLVVLYEIEGDDDNIRYRPEDDENYYGEYPLTVEPGDYYSEEVLGVDKLLFGMALVKFFRRYGIPDYTKNRNIAMARLMNLALQYYGSHNKKDFLRSKDYVYVQNP